MANAGETPAATSMSDETPPAPTDITALTTRMVRGEELAYREFYDGYFNRLLRYLLVVTGGREESAREALQLTLMRVVRHVRKFEAEAAFWSWLTVLARSSVVDEERKRKRYLRLLDRFFQAGLAGLAATGVNESDADVHLLKLLEQHLAGLAEEDHELIRRKYFAGCSVKEIADDLHTTEKAVESRLVRVRRKLKEAIDAARIEGQFDKDEALFRTVVGRAVDAGVLPRRSLQLIDSSPMYGPAESLVGELLKTTTNTGRLFTATKVWIDGREAGIAQMQQSMQRLGVSVIDLMQVHNLRDWRVHLQTLRQWKAQGKIRYLGITTSHGRLHDEFETIMKTEPLDFAQFTYNLVDRTPEKRLFPLAADKGIATLINRPFQRGEMFGRVRGKTLPEWAAEFDCKSWGQFFLKFIVSHPNVTNVIPATSNVAHMVDNMGAGYGRLPDAKTRECMIKHFESL